MVCRYELQSINGADGLDVDDCVLNDRNLSPSSFQTISMPTALGVGCGRGCSRASTGRASISLMGAPSPFASNQPPEGYLTAIGDINISAHWIDTPSGQFPIRGTTWTVTDMSQTHERMSPVGVILCIIFIWFCLLGLLFLLMKETVISGYVQVTVQGNGFQHSTMILAGPQTAFEVNQVVNYARRLAASA